MQKLVVQFFGYNIKSIFRGIADIKAVKKLESYRSHVQVGL